ncbi:hypothetical protein C0989_005405 [Termitomyces sp. Mn162]|nr:hypothetical protein C0989_005405 [Termitomyces sp. Mn162]
MTLGPLHCIANAPPATSPIVPSPAATPGAELWTPASTHPELMRTPRRHRPRGPNAPTPSLTPENEPSVTNGGAEDHSQRIPARPKVALLANQSSLRLATSSSAHSTSPPPELVPTPPLPLRAAPPSASDAPANPAPLMLTPLPHAPMCSFPAPLPLSPSAPRHNPPLPVGAHPPVLPTTLSKPPPACEGRPP